MSEHNHPFSAKEDHNDWFAVWDGFHVQIDCIPSLLVAETIAGEMNLAWQRGYAAAQREIREALGMPV